MNRSRSCRSAARSATVAAQAQLLHAGHPLLVFRQLIVDLDPGCLVFKPDMRFRHDDRRVIETGCGDVDVRGPVLVHIRN